MERRQSPIRVACVQMDIAQNQTERNLAVARRMIGEACAQGASLIALPELFSTGCVFDSRAQAFAAAEPVPGGRSTELLLNLSRAHGVYLAASLLERQGPDLYNTAILTGPEGVVGKYRKLHPCEDEVYWIEPGDLGLPVFHTPIGRIGLLVCLDAYYPETFRILAMQGADVVCVPFNAGDVKEARGLPDPYCTVAPVLCMANAVSNHILVMGADRVGRTGSVKFAGQSVIADQWGAPVAGPASSEGEEILLADVDLCDSRRKYFHPTNSRLANRRTDVYSAGLGYCPEKYGRG